MDLKIEWPEADLKRMATQIERAQIQLGKTLEESLVWAGLLLARGAAARTTASPKKRKTERNDGSDKKFNPKIFPYFRTVWKNGPEDTYKWHMKDRSDSRFQEIKKSGLAKKSWIWMIPWIKGAGGKGFASEVNKKKAMFDVEIEMANMLGYISKALKVSDGQVLLNEALGKTASRMEKLIDNKLRQINA